MPIELDRKDPGNYGKKYVDKQLKDEYKLSKENFNGSDLFEKFVHTEVNKIQDPKKREITFLRFNSPKLGINWSTIYFTDSFDLNKVEVYFFKSSDIPLIVAIVTNKPKYYIARVLRSLGNISNKGKAFTPENLLDKLIEENNKQNKVITYRLEKKSSDDGLYDGVTVEKVNHPSFDKYKHIPVKKLSKFVLPGHKKPLEEGT